MQARFITAIGLSLLSLLMPAAKAESAAESAPGYRNSALEPPLRRGDQRFLINPLTPGDRPTQSSAIEVRISRMMEVDCNLIQISGSFQPSTTSSTPHSIWRLSDKIETISTAMGCPIDEPLRLIPITMNHGEPSVIPWNGRNPVVIDLPEGWTLQWRKAGSDAAFQSEPAL